MHFSHEHTHRRCVFQICIFLVEYQKIGYWKLGIFSLWQRDATWEYLVCDRDATGILQFWNVCSSLKHQSISKPDKNHPWQCFRS